MADTATVAGTPAEPDPSEIDRLCRTVIDFLGRGRVIAFLGAGVNLAGRGETFTLGQNLPDGKELAKVLREAAAKHIDVRALTLLENEDLPQVAQYFENKKKADILNDELFKVLKEAAPTVAHRLVASFSKLAPQIIITTNYDRLLENALTNLGIEHDVVYYYTSSSATERGYFHQAPGKAPVKIEQADSYSDLPIENRRPTRTIVFKIHGAVREDADTSSFMISEDNYIDFLALLDKDVKIPSSLLAAFSNKRFLFLGYSLKDWNMRVFFNRLTRDNRFTLDWWAVINHITDLDELSWSCRGVECHKCDLVQFCTTFAEIGNSEGLPITIENPKDGKDSKPVTAGSSSQTAQ